jgi:hypothetical protein
MKIKHFVLGIALLAYAHSNMAHATDLKFSQFANGGAQQVSDQVVGLRGGVNTIFNAATGNGTVTSVGLNMPAGWIVTGSPITNSGVFGVTTNWQINKVRQYNAFTVGFNNPRTPSMTNDTQVLFSITITNAASQSATVNAQISYNSCVTWNPLYGQGSTAQQPSTPYGFSFIVPAGSCYRIVNSGTGSTAMSQVSELTL